MPNTPHVYQQGVPATRDPGANPPGQDEWAPLGRPKGSTELPHRRTGYTSAGLPPGIAGAAARGTGVLGDPYFICGTGLYGEPEPNSVDTSKYVVQPIPLSRGFIGLIR